jgi:hypothetical protein
VVSASLLDESHSCSVPKAVELRGASPFPLDILFTDFHSLSGFCFMVGNSSRGLPEPVFVSLDQRLRLDHQGAEVSDFRGDFTAVAWIADDSESFKATWLDSI